MFLGNRDSWTWKSLVPISGLFILLALPSGVLADGNDELGPPSITIESGTGLIVAGAGLDSQPGIINLTVPTGATVAQVLLYWEGQTRLSSGALGDDTIVINAMEVTGTLIGEVERDDQSKSWTYRADITGLGLITPGPNVLSVGGLAFDAFDNGAGILAIIDDGSGAGPYRHPRRQRPGLSILASPQGHDRCPDIHLPCRRHRADREALDVLLVHRHHGDG